MPEHAGRRFGNDHGNRSLPVLFADAADDSGNPVPRVGKRFATGRTDRFGMLLPLAIEAGLRLAQLFDSFAVPEAAIEVSEFLVDTDFPILAGEQLSRLARGKAWRTIDDIDRHIAKFSGEPSRLLVAFLVERNVERPLDPPLDVEIGSAWQDQNDS